MENMKECTFSIILELLFQRMQFFPLTAKRPPEKSANEKSSLWLIN
jgi:hypothetical protein